MGTNLSHWSKRLVTLNGSEQLGLFCRLRDERSGQHLRVNVTLKSKLLCVFKSSALGKTYYNTVDCWSDYKIQEQIPWKGCQRTPALTLRTGAWYQVSCLHCMYFRLHASTIFFCKSWQQCRVKQLAIAKLCQLCACAVTCVKYGRVGLFTDGTLWLSRPHKDRLAVKPSIDLFLPLTAENE